MATTTSLIAYLLQTKDLGFGENNVTAVLGNPSCDLDSCISAIALAFFYSNCPDTARRRVCVPVLNLPDTKSSELWRFRPEFGVALRLAVDAGEDEPEDVKAREKGLLEYLTTIADLRKREDSGVSALQAAFASQNPSVQSGEQKGAGGGKLKVILVDHNVPSIPGLSLEEIKTRIEVVGVLDHHEDEGYVEKTAQPRTIQTGIGSCASLVVDHLRKEKLWPDAPGNGPSDFAEIATLALAPILIDTANLTAGEDKNSPTDKRAVEFLQAHAASRSWDRAAFYQAVSTAKSAAINLLSIPEIFARDYKEWQETSPTSPDGKEGQKVTIGMSSLTAPLLYLVQKSDYTTLLDEIQSYMRQQRLSLFAILSVFHDDKSNRVKKEDLVIASTPTAVEALERFQKKAVDELKLEEWHEDDEFLRSFDNRIGRSGGAYSVWCQGDVDMSRKQVAPLLRGAVRGHDV